MDPCCNRNRYRSDLRSMIQREPRAKYLHEPFRNYFWDLCRNKGSAPKLYEVGYKGSAGHRGTYLGHITVEVLRSMCLLCTGTWTLDDHLCRIQGSKSFHPKPLKSQAEALGVQILDSEELSCSASSFSMFSRGLIHGP